MKLTNLDFGTVLGQLKAGHRIARAGWNGKGMYLLYVGGNDWNADTDAMDEREAELETAPFIAMKTADAKLVPWLASQTDILAEDWFVLE
jgi:hypothetical protein